MSIVHDFVSPLSRRRTVVGLRTSHDRASPTGRSRSRSVGRSTLGLSQRGRSPSSSQRPHVATTARCPAQHVSSWRPAGSHVFTPALAPPGVSSGVSCASHSSLSFDVTLAGGRALGESLELRRHPQRDPMHKQTPTHARIACSENIALSRMAKTRRASRSCGSSGRRLRRSGSSGTTAGGGRSARDRARAALVDARELAGRLLLTPVRVVVIVRECGVHEGHSGKWPRAMRRACSTHPPRFAAILIDSW